MTREYSRIFVKVILVFKQPSKVIFWTSKLILNFLVHILDLNPFKLLSNNLKLDLDVHIWRYHRISWSSRSIIIGLYKILLRGSGRRRGDGTAAPAREWQPRHPQNSLCLLAGALVKCA